MIDRNIYIINGWKVEGREQVKQLDDELYKINEDYMNDLEGFYIYDSMCGEYAYFGSKLGSMDVKYEDSNDIIINEKLLYDADKKYKMFLKKYPKYEEIFKKYSNNTQPQVMVVLHVW